ncbi:MAG TPA: RES domain-containing protein [Nocardioidaceae bacterium]|nr:RES domain-containing protein [Nocardioidaceae bacterium]
MLWRVLPWDASAADNEPGGPLWVPRDLQGSGRHDAPDHYGCLYLAERAVSAVAEALAPFRGTGDLAPDLLIRSGRALALAGLELDEGAPRRELVDLDDPGVLVRENLRPSTVATGHRETTQEYALAQFLSHPRALGLRWWSTLEAPWSNVTLFDRAAARLAVADVQPLGVEDEPVVEAAVFLGLA